MRDVRTRSIGASAVCLLGFFAATIAAGRADEGRCLIVVNGRTYLKGMCNIQLRPGGSFTVGIGDESRSEYFAFVTVESPGTARGYWNGAEAEDHAHTELGTLVRKGACWSNAHARVCAWRR